LVSTHCRKTDWVIKSIDIASKGQMNQDVAFL
jgi:hypothetical protein